MEKAEKICVINSEVEAKLIEEILTERGIPHIIRSYRDLLFDGLWQTPTVWGELQAPASSREEILRLIEEISKMPPDGYQEMQE
jgi:hypothetical protein